MYIDELSEMFTEFKVYPLSSYSENTPVRIFQNLYSENYFSKDIKRFLDLHDYKPVRRGADLPWWGKSFFENNNHKKVMIVSQDSLSDDAGSIVFGQIYMMLLVIKKNLKITHLYLIMINCLLMAVGTRCLKRF